MSAEELRALIQLINRIPLTEAERLWVQGLLEQLSNQSVNEKNEEGETDVV